jgi:hypothetical protein
MTRFTIDLLHPGRLAERWQDWFVGARSQQRMVVIAGSGLILLVLGYVFGVYVPSRRLVRHQTEVAQLRRALEAKTEDLKVLKTDLDALSAEARRQVRWSELLTTFTDNLPAVLRLQKVAYARTTPPGAGTPNGTAPRAEGVMQIEAQTPLKPGGPPLLETAKFMAGIMRDPAVNKRFLLRSWEVRPPASIDAEASPMLQVNVTLAERTP